AMFADNSMTARITASTVSHSENSANIPVVKRWQKKRHNPGEIMPAAAQAAAGSGSDGAAIVATIVAKKSAGEHLSEFTHVFSPLETLFRLRVLFHLWLSADVV